MSNSGCKYALCAHTHDSQTLMFYKYIILHVKPQKRGATHKESNDQWDWKNKKRGHLYVFEFHKCIKIVVRDLEILIMIKYP